MAQLPLRLSVNGSARWVRWSIAGLALLLVILLPFLLFGDRLDALAASQQTLFTNPGTVAVWGAAALALDILLPIPASIVSAWIGTAAGFWLGAIAIWLGTVAAASIGYLIGWYLGEPALERFVGKPELERAQSMTGRVGLWSVFLARGVPVLAEATAIYAGALRLHPASFALAVASSAAILAITYAGLGSLAGNVAAAFPVALGTSIAVPLFAWLGVRLSGLATRPARPGQTYEEET
jgi:uncharacterized membrane protein YdjX (TVP38/TMEM64 family)